MSLFINRNILHHTRITWIRYCLWATEGKARATALGFSPCIWYMIRMHLGSLFQMRFCFLYPSPAYERPIKYARQKCDCHILCSILRGTSHVLQSNWIIWKKFCLMLSFICWRMVAKDGFLNNSAVFWSWKKYNGTTVRNDCHLLHIQLYLIFLKFSNIIVPSCNFNNKQYLTSSMYITVLFFIQLDAQNLIS